ncbi:MAG: hypothetical protein HY010_16595 [Acidobacteria bacterium]|nr:hypothetical protein [Acidobacteriota bacterium]
METYENRIVNGLLKAEAVDDPDRAAGLLLRDIEIVADPRRATDDDLWPAIWALASVLERQFSGNIYITAGLTSPLRQPAQLSSRCRFVRHTPLQNAITIHLGCLPSSPDLTLCGDARRATVHYGSVIESSERATPLSCFALAGYLGFAALALAAGIPIYREEFAVPQISLPFQCFELPRLPKGGLQFIGLGHLGQAYIALLFFLAPVIPQVPRIQLVDKDFFESPNWSTQILIETQSQWIGCAKADYLRERAQTWGWEAESERTEITWGWHRSERHSEFAVMGLDKFDVRRMAIAGGYSWVFDAGLGDSFLHPRVSWHSIPANNSLARRLFPSTDPGGMPRPQTTTPFIDRLRATPGACGLLIYEGIQASAPSLGMVASAFVWSEILRFLSGEKQQIQGSATIWSPILPPLRNVLES